MPDRPSITDLSSSPATPSSGDKSPQQSRAGCYGMVIAGGCVGMAFNLLTYFTLRLLFGPHFNVPIYIFFPLVFLPTLVGVLGLAASRKVTDSDKRMGFFIGLLLTPFTALTLAFLFVTTICLVKG